MVPVHLLENILHKNIYKKYEHLCLIPKVQKKLEHREKMTQKKKNLKIIIIFNENLSQHCVYNIP